ncbi:hypothetical protein Fmac_024367 [Flemingia macrophylla]|uniref:Rubisco accumulation factor 1 C-terminal domain-containing protein n=1 Tax=Flemingia macrophylla TaxID=520843 RepID=A0ABD1LP75_9FABA
MISLSPLNLKPISPNDLFLSPSPHRRRHHHHHHRTHKPISAVLNSSSFSKQQQQQPSPAQQQVYQPFRPPPAPLPSQYGSLDLAGRIEPVVGLGDGGVVVSFPDARVLPWKANRWYKEEPILVVADRSNTEVAADDAFYLVNIPAQGFKVERGFTLKENGVTHTLGNVVIVVRPPKEEYDDQLSDEDWE